MKKVIFIVALLLWTNQFVFAHSGRTDSAGCHTCRTNCSSWGLSNGEYHCHGAKTSPQPEEPIKSTYGDNGTGYTQPAPEYKMPNPNTASEGTPNSSWWWWVVGIVVAGIGYNYLKNRK